MKKRSETGTYAVALGGGALLWLAATLIGGRREAWDSSLYWVIAYPLSIALSGYLGYANPARPWRWALAVMFAQAAMLCVLAADFSLLPLGLILFGVLALPAITAARYMASYRRAR